MGLLHISTTDASRDRASWNDLFVRIDTLQSPFCWDQHHSVDTTARTVPPRGALKNSWKYSDESDRGEFQSRESGRFSSLRCSASRVALWLVSESARSRRSSADSQQCKSFAAAEDSKPPASQTASCFSTGPALQALRVVRTFQARSRQSCCRRGKEISSFCSWRRIWHPNFLFDCAISSESENGTIWKSCRNRTRVGTHFGRSFQFRWNIDYVSILAVVSNELVNAIELTFFTSLAVCDLNRGGQR